MIISFEGIEGVGKSTQINLLKDWFEKRNLKTIILREPGSTKASEKIRDILLSNDISLANETELLLMFSARAQLINEKIVNSKYDIILLDEYFDLKQRVSLQKKKIDDLSNKFQEIKKLAIKYKDGKDKEIDNLNEELDSFKKTAEESNNLYESMLDKTTKSLEKILLNTESNSKIQ